MTNNFGNKAEGLINFNFTDNNTGDWIRELHIQYRDIDHPGIVEEVTFRSVSRSDYYEADGNFKLMKDSFNDPEKTFEIRGYINYVARADTEWSQWIKVGAGTNDVLVTVNCTGFHAASIDIKSVRH
jgi:hypothetical protein